LGHWVPPWEKLPYNNPTRNPLARSYSFVKTAKLLHTFLQGGVKDENSIWVFFRINVI